MRLRNVILALVVVAIVIVGYMALVGVKADEAPIGPSSDPMADDEDDEREPIAYGYFGVSLGLDNEIGGYDVDIRDFVANIYYDDGTQKLALYEVERWDVLGIWTDKIDVKMVCTITGPFRWEATWEDSYSVELSEWGYDWTDLTSGYATFWDKGEYRADMKVYTDGPEFDGLAASATFYFSV